MCIHYYIYYESTVSDITICCIIISTNIRNTIWAALDKRHCGRGTTVVDSNRIFSWRTIETVPTAGLLFSNRAKESRKGLEDGLLAIVDQELCFDILSSDGIVKMLEHGTVVSIKMDAMRKNKMCERELNYLSGNASTNLLGKLKDID